MNICILTLLQEKLILSLEQERIREHGRAARAMANQNLPLSVCTILKNEEIYHAMDAEQVIIFQIFVIFTKRRRYMQRNYTHRSIDNICTHTEITSLMFGCL